MAEAHPGYPEVKQTTMDQQLSITIRDTLFFNEIAEKMGKMYGALYKFSKSKRYEMAGPPFCAYEVWNPEAGYTIARCGIPMNKEVKGKGPIEFFVIEPSEALLIEYKGPYDKMEAQYLAMDEYMAEFGLEPNGGPIEVYVNDPGNEPDPTKWITNIYMPIK